MLGQKIYFAILGPIPLGLRLSCCRMASALLMLLYLLLQYTIHISLYLYNLLEPSFPPLPFNDSADEDLVIHDDFISTSKVALRIMYPNLE